MSTLLPSSPTNPTIPVQAPPRSDAVEDRDVDAWHEDELEEESFFENQETTALIGSMLVHLIVILTLALVPLRAG